MKTKEEIRKNLYESAKVIKEGDRWRLEFYLITLFSCFLLGVLLLFSVVSSTVVFYSFLVLCFFLLSLIIVNKNITKVPERSVLKKMKELVEREIWAAKRSNYSCETQIEKLEKIKEEITY